MLSEVSQSQKDKYCRVPFIWGIYYSQTHRSTKWNGRGPGLGRGEMNNCCAMRIEIQSDTIKKFKYNDVHVVNNTVLYT